MKGHQTLVINVQRHVNGIMSPFQNLFQRFACFCKLPPPEGKETEKALMCPLVNVNTSARRLKVAVHRGMWLFPKNRLKRAERSFRRVGLDHGSAQRFAFIMAVRLRIALRSSLAAARFESTSSKAPMTQGSESTL